MNKAQKIQIVILGLGVVLVVLLFSANRKPLPKKNEMAMRPGAASKALDSKGLEQQRMEKLATKDRLLWEMLQKDQESAKQLDSALAVWDKKSVFWNMRNQPVLAAWQLEQKAKQSGKGEDWREAGRKYYTSVQFEQDASLNPSIYGQAIACLEKALLLLKDDSETAILLASCYVDGTSEPMKGIGLLKEVEKRDSGNFKLQMAFASFSVKSGQFDKALQRYQKALKINPEYLEIYLYLADVYRQKGEVENAIAALEQFVRQTKDKATAREVKQYIENLKNNINH